MPSLVGFSATAQPRLSETVPASALSGGGADLRSGDRPGSASRRSGARPSVASIWRSCPRASSATTTDPKISSAQIWNDPTVPWWYREGVFLYVDEPVLQDVTKKTGVRSDSAAIDLVHPEPWLSALSRRQRPISEGTSEARLGLPAALGEIARWSRRDVRARHNRSLVDRGDALRAVVLIVARRRRGRSRHPEDEDMEDTRRMERRRNGPSLHLGASLLTFNRPEALRLALEALLSQSRPPEVVVVVDNGVSNDIRALVADFSGVLYDTPGENLGSAGGVAFGLQRLHALGLDWLYSVDDDTPPLTHDTLEKLEALILRHEHDEPRVGIVGVVGSRWDWRKGEQGRLRRRGARG